MLFIEAWCFLGTARLMLLFVSFKKIAAGFTKNKMHTNRPTLTQMQLRSIGLAIQRGCRYSWWRTKCFEQAICARWMLQRRKQTSILYFGVKKNELSNVLEAHAWLSVEEYIVTGGAGARNYTIINNFRG